MEFSTSFNAVFPIVLYLVIGILSKKLKLLDSKTSHTMNSFLYTVFFPCLMLNNIFTAGDTAFTSFRGPLFLIVYTIILCIICIILVPVFIKDKSRIGVFIQALIRGNSIIFAIPVVTLLCGENNIGFVSICVAFLVPFTNALGVIILESYRGGKINAFNIIKNVIKNPLVISAIIGLLLVGFKVPVPQFIRSPIKSISNALTPISLMILGFDLRFDGLKKDIRDLGIVSVVKLIIIPLTMYLSARYFGFNGYELVSILVIGAVPTAVSTYALAIKLEGDGEFAGEVVAVTSVLSVFTVFMWLVVLSF